MNAFEIPALRFSLPAGGAVAEHRFVSAANDAAVQATEATAVIGVSMNRTTADEIAAGPRIVEIADGIVMVEAGDAVASGSAVKSDASGKAVVAAEGGIAVAITAAAAAGELIAVKL